MLRATPHSSPARRAAVARGIVVAALFIAAGQAFAADESGTVGDRLHEVERALEAGRGEAVTLKRKASELAQKLESARSESVAAAKAIQDHEAELTNVWMALCPKLMTPPATAPAPKGVEKFAADVATGHPERAALPGGYGRPFPVSCSASAIGARLRVETNAQCVPQRGPGLWRVR